MPYMLAGAPHALHPLQVTDPFKSRNVGVQAFTAGAVSQAPEQFVIVLWRASEDTYGAKRRLELSHDKIQQRGFA